MHCFTCAGKPQLQRWQMKKNGFSHIRKWLWGFLFLVILTAAFTFLLTYQEILRSLDEAVLGSSGSSVSAGQPIAAVQWTALKFRLHLLFTAGLVVISAGGYLWIRVVSQHLNRPIRVIRQALSRLASGKLNETVSLETTDELGQIGAGINELAANLQELLLYIWKQTGECNFLLEQIKENHSGNPAQAPNAVNPEQLHKLDEAIQNLREMAKAYVFYDVRLDGEQALAVNEPGKVADSDGAPR